MRLHATGMWRSGRDSNPRYGFAVYSLSRRAPSTTRPPLRMLWKSADLVGSFRFGKRGGETVDRARQRHVLFRDAAGAVRGKQDVDPVPDIGPFRMVVRFLRRQ